MLEIVCMKYVDMYMKSYGVSVVWMKFANELSYHGLILCTKPKKLYFPLPPPWQITRMQHNENGAKLLEVLQTDMAKIPFIPEIMLYICAVLQIMM